MPLSLWEGHIELSFHGQEQIFAVVAIWEQRKNSFLRQFAEEKNTNLQFHSKAFPPRLIFHSTCYLCINPDTHSEIHTRTKPRERKYSIVRFIKNKTLVPLVRLLQYFEPT